MLGYAYIACRALILFSNEVVYYACRCLTKVSMFVTAAVDYFGYSFT